MENSRSIGKKRARDEEIEIDIEGGTDESLSLGFFLNPRFQYEEGFVYSDNIRSGVTKVIERLAPNVTFAIEATREIAQFRGKIGRFGDLTAQTAVGIMNPENNLTFSDTLIALRIMRSQFPKIEKVSIQPFILRSQLYSSVNDRTQVDRELESLRKEKVLRIFKLNTGQDDHAIMFMDDYLNQMGIVVKRMEAKNQNVAVFEWFKAHVLDSKLDISIEHNELCSLLSAGGSVRDEHVSLLINGGLLTRQLVDSNTYWFTIPNIGSVLKGLSQGRKELLSFLNRRRYKEMLMASLEKKRLRQSQLDIRFHIRDLIGSGHLKTLQTPTGLLVRVVKE